jgi:GH15 family glucan-1,4-alpha-glucosidase
MPDGEFSTKQYYRENTNVLCTEISSVSGTYRITDCAPRFVQHDRHVKPLMLIRKIEPLSGVPRIKVACKPVGNYGLEPMKMMQGSDRIIFSSQHDKLELSTNIPINYIMNEDFFVLNETKYIVLLYGESLESGLARTAENYITETVQYWRLWIKHCSIANFHQPHVIRSALVLKIHQYEDTGAIIAASTTSLPEFPGSGRNWDYRYCWLRDAHYILTALNHIGHFEEMERYFNYISDITTAEDFRYQPLYSIRGKKNLNEYHLDHLDGYMGNQPVRIGNQASEHIQNDIYGQVLISLLPLYSDHRFVFSERKDSSRWIETILYKIEKTIDERDAGIWEFRSMANVHCYSNLFQWAGCNAAIKIADIIGDLALKDKAIWFRQKAADHIERCYSPERKAYTTGVGVDYLDASTLQLIMMKYLDPASQRARDHLTALEKELKTPGGLFFRYIHEDDFGKPKTTFLICAFWYVEALACVGRIDDAVREFENLLQYCNHLMLFSEDVDEKTGSQWGNFPQAYSHVGLMNAAYRISMKLDLPAFL